MTIQIRLLGYFQENAIHSLLIKFNCSKIHWNIKTNRTMLNISDASMRNFRLKIKHQAQKFSRSFYTHDPGKSWSWMNWKISVNPMRARFHYNIERGERLNINSIIVRRIKWTRNLGEIRFRDGSKNSRWRENKRQC